MNILINYPKSGESGPAFVLELAKGLKKNGQNLYAVLPRRIPNANEWSQEFTEENIYWLKSPESRNKIDKLFKLIFVDFIAIKMKFWHKIDISTKPFYSTLGPVLDKAINSRLKAAVCHDPILHSGANISKESYRKFYRENDDIFVLTKSFIPVVQREFDFPRDRIHYFPHGRMNMYQITKEYSKIQSEYKKKYHLLFFGRIEKYKGLHILSDAYNRVVSQNSDIELTILGSGKFDEYKDEYSHLPNVHVINRYIKDDEVGNYFALPNTIVVVPYVDATQSGVIPIAFEFGTPVVASNQGGLREQLDDGRLGLLYDNNDPKELANKILELMDDEKCYQKECEKMLRYSSNLGWDNVAKQLLDNLKLSKEKK